MKPVHQISNAGHTYLPPKPGKKIHGNIRKDGKFVADFASVHSCSLRALRTPPAMQSPQQTPAKVASQLLTLLTLGSVAGTVIAAQGTSFPDSFSGGKNTRPGPDASFAFSPANQHFQSSHVQHGAAHKPEQDSITRSPHSHPKTTKALPEVNKKPDTKNPKLMRPRQALPSDDQPDGQHPKLNPKLHPKFHTKQHPYPESSPSDNAPPHHPMTVHPPSNAAPHPPLSAAENSLADSKERSFITDASNMLQRASADTYMSPNDPISRSWMLPGVNLQPKFSMMNPGWRETIRERADRIQRENAREKEEFDFMENIKINPFVDSSSTFIDEVLGDLLESEGLSRDVLNTPIYAQFYDQRPVHAPSSHLQPQQPKVIEYSAYWTLKQIATGQNFYEIEAKAGSMAAHNNDVTYHWPTTFPPHLKKLITTGWFWRTFVKFMAARLTSGPLVDEAKRTIKVQATELFSRHYDGDPAQSDAQLTDFLNNARPVFFGFTRVAGLFLAPSVTAGSYGTLYSMNNTLVPANVEHAHYRLDYDALKEVVKNGLPLRKIAELDANLFTKYWSKPPFQTSVEPYLSFFDTPDSVENILWRAAMDKLFSDMDLNVLSVDEKNMMLMLGLVKSGMKGGIMVLAPTMSPMLSLSAAVVSTLPDIALAQVADQPERANAHLSDFFVGAIIECVGLQFFIAHKAVIMSRIAKSVSKFEITPAIKNSEQSKLTNWATDYKNYVNLTPHEKFFYLAHNIVTTPAGNLARKLAQGTSSWDFVSKLEHDAGLITTSQLERITTLTRVDNFAAFLSTTPKIIRNQEEFLALPAGSRFAFINVNGRLEHTMSKLDGSVAIGYKNGYLGIENNNAVQAVDFIDAISWSADGLASINEGPAFTVQANPIVSGHDEKHPSTRPGITIPLTTIQLTTIQLSQLTATKPRVGPITQTEPGKNVISLQLPDDDKDDFEGLTALIVLPALAALTDNCTKSCTDQKIDRILTALLARVNDIPHPAAAALQKKYTHAVSTALTELSLDRPEDAWNSLPIPVRKLVETTYLLEDHVNNFVYDDALELAAADYAQQLNPATFDHIYFDLHKPLMHTLEQDTALVHSMRESPSQALTQYLQLDSREKIDAFLNKIQEISVPDSAGRAITEERSSPTLVADMLAYSSEMTAIFLKDFQQDALPLPRSFDQMAWFYDYLQCKDAGLPWVFDTQKGAAQTAPTIRANFSRRLGFEKALPHLVTAVLNTLGYSPSRMGLSGSYGQSLHALSHRSELNTIPGYNILSEQEQLSVFDAVQARTGISDKYLLGSLAASVDTAINLFPDGDGLADIHYPEGVDALFSQIITLDLAIANNARKIDAPWIDDFWQLMLDRSTTVPGLENLIDHLTRQHPEHKADRVIAAAHHMYRIARMSPGPTMPAELIDFAIQRVRYQLRTPPIGGSSPGMRAESIRLYLQRELERLGIRTPPASIEEWKQWLTTQTPDVPALHPRWIGPPNQQAISNTLINVIQTINLPINAEKLAALQASADEEPYPLSNDPQHLIGTELLVRSGFDNIKTTIDKSEFDVKLLGIEGTVTTVSERERSYGKAWYDERFRGENFLYAQMLARDTRTGTFYANKLPTGQKAATLEVAGHRLGDIPSLALLTKILGDLTDFTDHNGTRIFHDIFHFKQADVDATRHDPLKFFNTFYNNSLLFRAIVNAAQPFVGKWTPKYGQAREIDPVRNFFYIPWDSQWQYLPKEVDMTGAPQPISAPRLYLEQWLSIFLQQRPTAVSSGDQDLTGLLTNIILDQVGLLTYESHSSYKPATPLAIPERLYQQSKRQWENRYANALLTDITAEQYRQAGAHNASSEAVTSTLNRLSALTPQAVHLPTFSAINIEAGNNTEQYLDHFLKIGQNIFERRGIGAQLMSKYRYRISAQFPWYLICIDPKKTPRILKPYGASHRIESYTQTLFVADPVLHPVFYLSDNGLTPLDRTRQAVYIWMQLLLSTPDIEGKPACTQRSEAGLFTEIILEELNHKSPTAIAVATVDTSKQIPTLTLLNTALSVTRRSIDDNKMLRDALWRYWGIRQ